MVSNFTIIALLTTSLICLLFPAIITYFVRKKQRGYFGPIIVGAISFFVFQVVFRIPIVNTVLPTFSWFNEDNILAVAFTLALSAALFETVGRWFTMKFLLRDRKSFNTGVLHGVGHGATEAMLLVGINFFIYSLFALQLNSSGVDEFITQFSGQSEEVIKSMNELVDIITNQSAWLFLLSGYERVMAMIVHIGLSLVVMQGFMKNEVFKYSLFAFAAHFALDFGVILIPALITNVLVVEGYVTVFAIALAIYVFKIRKVHINQLESEIENQKYIDSDY